MARTSITQEVWEFDDIWWSV